MKLSRKAFTLIVVQERWYRATRMAVDTRGWLRGMNFREYERLTDLLMRLFDEVWLERWIQRHPN